MATNPSYLCKRGSIYYFQTRIPIGHDCTNGYNPRKIIRRSTRTGNRREALRIARKWWGQVMENDFQFEGQAETEAMERQIDFEEKMYFKGMEIAGRVSKINRNISFEWNRFAETLSDYDIRCLEFYEKQQEKQRNTPHALSTPYEQPKSDEELAYLIRGVKPTTEKLSDLVAKYIEYNTDKNNPWTEGTKKKITSQLNLFVEMVSNPYSHKLSPEIMRDGYANRIQKIPAAINNKKNLYFNGNERKPIDEIILIGEKIGAKKLKAFADHTRNISTFVRVTLRSGVWAELKKAALSLVHQLAMSAEKRWRRLRGFRQLADVITDVRFIYGVNDKETGGRAAGLRMAIHNIKIQVELASKLSIIEQAISSILWWMIPTLGTNVLGWTKQWA